MSKIIKISYESIDGVIHYVDGNKDIQTILLATPKHIQFKKTGSITSLRNKYFALVDELHKACNTGYTKSELHSNLKCYTVRGFEEFPDLVTKFTGEYTTKYLTAKGWSEAIERLRARALDIFNYTFKQD